MWRTATAASSRPPSPSRERARMAERAGLAAARTSARRRPPQPSWLAQLGSITLLPGMILITVASALVSPTLASRSWTRPESNSSSNSNRRAHHCRLVRCPICRRWRSPRHRTTRRRRAGPLWLHSCRAQHRPFGGIPGCTRTRQAWEVGPATGPFECAG